jgi:hypothetical protein
MPLSLVILAAGMSTRYGRLKQLEPVGPSGETLLDYGIFDARRAGFDRVVLVIRREIEEPIRAHLAHRWPGVPAALTFQDLERGDGGAVPVGRTKPWGTAHAILAASGAVDGAFAVSNADDFYGRAGYAALAAHLGGTSGEQALVGYRLEETLSAHGGVSRGICEADRTGLLRRITEVHDLRPAGALVRGRAPDGGERDYPADAVTSMNLWGFTPAIFPALRDGFAAFLAAHGTDPKAEYPISTAVGDLVTEGRIRLRVLPVGAGWMGVTFPADHATVADGLRGHAADGRYPSPLSAPAPPADPKRT